MLLSCPGEKIGVSRRGKSMVNATTKRTPYKEISLQLIVPAVYLIKIVDSLYYQIVDVGVDPKRYLNKLKSMGN
jgi:hypothetical protein